MKERKRKKWKRRKERKVKATGWRQVQRWKSEWPGNEASVWTWKLSTCTKAFNSGRGSRLSQCLVLSSALLNRGNGLQRQVSARITAQKHRQPLFIHPSACVTETGLQLRLTERERVHMEPQSSGWMFSHLCWLTGNTTIGLKAERRLCYSFTTIGQKRTWKICCTRQSKVPHPPQR